jgi:hypothetical protein
MKMGKQIIINLTNAWLYSFIAIGVLLLLIVGIYAYTASIPDPGHGGDKVLITLPDGTETTLQQAITDNKIGGGATSFTFAKTGYSSKFIGKNRPCFSFVYYFRGPCHNDEFVCYYNPTSGYVTGGITGGCGDTNCAYICFD